MRRKRNQNIGMISYFNNRVGNLVIKRFFENNIKIKNVILVGFKEKLSVRKNYFNYLNIIKLLIFLLILK